MPIYGEIRTTYFIALAGLRRVSGLLKQLLSVEIKVWMVSCCSAGENISARNVKCREGGTEGLKFSRKI